MKKNFYKELRNFLSQNSYDESSVDRIKMAEEIRKNLSKKDYKKNTIENFFKIVKKYLSLNNRENIGYNDKEIEKIERLYNIEIKGDFRTFMKFCGKYDGGLFGNDPVILYEDDVSYQLELQSRLKFYLTDIEYYDLDKSKIFLISVEMESNYFFIKTRDDDLRIYEYSEGINEVLELNIDFNEYMLTLVKDYNPELKPCKKLSISQLLIENDSATDNLLGEDKIDFELEDKENKKKYIYELEKYLALNNERAFGYSEKEIKLIEEIYDIEIKGDFKDFMRFAGRNDGGFVGDNLIILYQEWGIRNYLEFMMNFSDYLIETGIDNIGGGIFVFAIENDIHYYFIRTRFDDLRVFYYNDETKELQDTKLDFNQYMLNLVKKYNSEYKVKEKTKKIGELIKIDISNMYDKKMSESKKLKEKSKKPIEQTYDSIRDWLLPLLRKDDKIIFPKEEFLERVKFFDEAEKLRTFNVIKSAVEHDNYCVKFEEGNTIRGYEVIKAFGKMLGIAVEDEVVENVEETEVEEEKKLTPQQLRKKKFLERMKKSEEEK